MTDSKGRFQKGHGLIDITGQKFGRLTAIKCVGGTNNNGSIWLFKCDCGNTIEAYSSHVRRGVTKSCGCYNQDRRKERMTVHSFHKTKIQTAWAHMKQRCYNKNCKAYKDYGARGITVCDEWKDSLGAFGKWAMDNGWKDGLTLDRIDVNGNYCPENCRWVDMVVQESNKRNNRYITYNGEKMTISECARRIGMKQATLYGRIVRKGMDVEEAVKMPVKERK